MSRLSKAELALIRDMIDELVVNRGTLDLRNLKVSVSNLDFHRLALIACRYYRVTIEGKMSCDFSDVERIGNQLTSTKTGNGPACMTCGGQSAVTITKESSFMPLCYRCHLKLDADIEIFSSLMPE